MTYLWVINTKKVVLKTVDEFHSILLVLKFKSELHLLTQFTFNSNSVLNDTQPCCKHALMSHVTINTIDING